jgi:hypothetical protein
MMDSAALPEGVDPTRPSAARMYDYYLGGSHHFQIDRTAAEQVLALAPWTREMAISNRHFLRRVVTYLAGACQVRQFLDLGSGVPTVGNVHEVARGVDPDCRVVYVDRDRVAVAHSRWILAGDPAAAVVEADIRDPISVMTRPELSILDLSQPVALLMLSILPFVEDADRPGTLVAAYLSELAVGSFLAVSHASLDGVDGPLHEQVQRAARIYERHGSRVALRSRAEIESWFAGLRLVDPGVVPLSEWRPDTDDPEFRDMHSFGGVAQVTR